MDGAHRGGYLNLLVASRKVDSISLGNEVLTCQDVYCEPWLLHHFKEKETKSCCCRQLLQTSTERHSRICCFSSPAPDTTQRSMRPDSAHELEKIEAGGEDFALLQLPSAWHFAGWKQPVSTCGQPRKYTEGPPTPVTMITVC